MSKKPMKGEKPDPRYPMTWPKLGSIKYDGIRLLMDGMEPRTAAMKELPNRYTVEKLRSFPALMDCDMELICGDPADPLCYNNTYRAVMAIEGAPEVDFYIFDICSSEPYQERLSRLHARKLAGELPANAKLVQQVELRSEQELDEFYTRVLEEGHEGVIVRNANGLYKFGRATAKSQDLLKLKPEDDSEFVILGVYEALENQNEAFVNELGRSDRSTCADGLVGKGTLGGFYAKDLHTGVEFNCPPGKMRHDERQLVWQTWLTCPDTIKGRIGKYRYFTIGVKDKPRHPRWIGWRHESDL